MPAGPSPRAARSDEFMMFPPSRNSEISAPRRPHSKKKPENHIPRPPNAFILFRSSFIKNQHVSTAVETNHSTLSTIIGLTWSSMPEEQRQVWHRKAKEALAEHKRKFPKYIFRPVQAKAAAAAAEQRKVREVQPKDTRRCAKIAELLVEGKTGDALSVAVQEFDKTHVPEVVTRFEPPITACAFRRSYSAPMIDASTPDDSQCFLQTPHNARSSSEHLSPSASTPMDTVVAQTQEIHSPVPTLPYKQDLDFDLANFSFEGITDAFPAFECDPLLSLTTTESMADITLGAPLFADASFSGNWPTSFLQSIERPLYMLTGTPLSAASIPQSPIFDDDFSGLFDPWFLPVLPQQDAVYGGYSNDTLYAAFNDSRLGGADSSHLDLAFTSFMTAIDQYYP
ncbi:hypothetical protein HYPSUDRAFT_65071 [Hypholoma sublateritium FD-334 SS-4]|uniref:HMG box domain-containing protein n=1 Tax=Hypholoma sublateritium (strain FD-334 SS-4) TaxID=945553 RepID=A0A0D2MMG2_HYPSF|nr:hypothetical protein HYPSUDRAFT_65071 [Hypholoma sublateritium FD-334 SS-4]